MTIFRRLVVAMHHPITALRGAREFRSGCGISFVDPVRSNAYDCGRELAHIATRRRWDW